MDIPLVAPENLFLTLRTTKVFHHFGVAQQFFEQR